MPNDASASENTTDLAPAKKIAQGYASEGAGISLGSVLVDGKADPEARVSIPLSMMNRHGLVAGATGTTLVVPTARYASGGYHAFNNGYAYHVRPDALEILAPDGSVVSHEPWMYYDSTEN